MFARLTLQKFFSLETLAKVAFFVILNEVKDLKPSEIQDSSLGSE